MEIEALVSDDGFHVLGPLLCKPKVFGDERGFFLESWNANSWMDILRDSDQDSVQFVQDNHSASSRGVLRGLHYQLPPHAQGKLVRCVFGKIYDVAVDLRSKSPTFGKYVGAILSQQNFFQLWIPEGFAHGFVTLSDKAEVLYKTTDFWYPDCERSIKWNDPNLLIDWPLKDLGEMPPTLSKKDAEAPLLSRLKNTDFFQ